MKWFLLIFFLVLISLPGLLFVGGVRYVDPYATEWKTNLVAPSLHFSTANNTSGIVTFSRMVYGGLIEYKLTLDEWWLENFIPKSQLFDVYQDMKTGIFNIDPLPNKVISTDNGWYFLGNDFGRVITESLGFDVFSDVELERVVDTTLLRHEWMCHKGIPYYLIIPPNKSFVYKDEIPIKARRYSTMKMQFVNALPDFVNYVEVAGVLMQNPSMPVYHKTDSHWNDYGSYLACKVLIDCINNRFPEVQNLNHSAKDFVLEAASHTDLTDMLRIPSNELQVSLKESLKLAPYYVNIGGGNLTEGSKSSLRIRKFQNPNGHLKVLVFHDSFGEAMWNYFCETFAETIFVHGGFDRSLILVEQPDLVIQVQVERNIDS